LLVHLCPLKRLVLRWLPARVVLSGFPVLGVDQLW
jgi:hypothetical protein